MLGSVIGGYLAEPEGRVPFLGGADILVKHPYIAPGLAMGILTVICAIVIWLMVPEVSIAQEWIADSRLTPNIVIVL